MNWNKLSIEHKQVIYDAVRYYQLNKIATPTGVRYNQCDEILSSLYGTLKRYEIASDSDCDIWNLDDHSDKRRTSTDL